MVTSNNSDLKLTKRDTFWLIYLRSPGASGRAVSRGSHVLLAPASLLSFSSAVLRGWLLSLVKLGKVVAGPKLTPYDPQCQKEPFFPVSSVPLGSWKVLGWDKHITIGQSLCPVGCDLKLGGGSGNVEG